MMIAVAICMWIFSSIFFYCCELSLSQGKLLTLRWALS
jgi:hypothetical protein